MLDKYQTANLSIDNDAKSLLETIK